MTPEQLPVAKADALIRQLVQTTHFYDEATGELYEPTELPVVHDPEGDEDSDVEPLDDVPTERWVSHPPNDAAEYSDRPVPTYVEDDAGRDD